MPLALWILIGYVRDLPIELDEAARIDGASVPVILVRIVLPLVRPGLLAAGVLVFIFSWNEFPVALNLTSERTATVPVSIASFAQEYVIQHTGMAAASLLSIVPALAFLILAQRTIIRGLTAGAVK
ncbi:carbohydrate ABC transporter permease [Bosea vestrisii]|nr:carbohydrate ABC transporter permease [Bosea vestrisii]WID99524.1 carbohydrate ABC transporter permease [Bosea vestrisii]